MYIINVLVTQKSLSDFTKFCFTCRASMGLFNNDACDHNVLYSRITDVSNGEIFVTQN